MKEKLGSVQNAVDRQHLDFYATNPKDVVEVCQLLSLDKSKSLRVLEPCAGNGHIVNVLRSYGHTVITNDIIEREFKLDYTLDYLSEAIPEQKFDLVLTNPPFKYAKEFILKSLEYADIVVIIARLDLLESKRRKEINQKHLKHVFVHTDRARFARDGNDSLFEQGTAMSTGWFVYVKNKTEKTTLEII